MVTKSIGTICALLVSLCLAAQESPTTTIRKTSELVTIPVLVTDRSGKPVHGLTKQDFQIIEEGKNSRTIAIFEEFQSVSGALAKSQNKETIFSNFPEESQPHRVTIIVLDMVNTSFAAQAHTRDELIKFLAGNVQSDNPIALLAIGRDGLKQIHALSTNPGVLVEALKRVSGQHSAGDTLADADLGRNFGDQKSAILTEAEDLRHFRSEADLMVNDFQQREAIRITLTALEQVAQAFSGVPGRKTLIWASSGFPFSIEDRTSLGGFSIDFLGDYERTFRAMNTANIAMYPVDAVGLFNPSYRPYDVSRPSNVRRQFPLQRSLYDRYQQSQDSLRAFASATGGSPCLSTNDITRCFKEAQADSNSYYMLAYYLPTEDRKPGWHKLKVSVQRKDVNLRARTGFLVPDPAIIRKDDTRKWEIIRALASPVDYTNLHLYFAWKSLTPDPAHLDHTLARFEMAIPSESLAIDQDNRIDIDIAGLAMTDKKKEGGELTKTVTAQLKPNTADIFRREGMRYGDVLSLPKGKFTVRFVVRDNIGGKIGTVTAPVEIN